MKLKQTLLRFWPILMLVFTALVFFWKFFLKNLVPIPADVIVGVYYPWRDYIWKGYLAGVPIKNGMLSDVVSIIYPWRIYGIGLLKSFKAPLWVPFALGGSPLLANFQSGLLYPLNILFWVLNEADAWSGYIILQPILASIFLYLFLRNLKLSVYSSLFGSVLFAYCGFFLAWHEYGILGHAGLWLPLILLSVDKMKEKNYLTWVILGAFFICFSILAGYPQITFYVLVCFCGYILFRFFAEKEKRYFLSFLSLLAGLGLSAVQLLPSFELLSLSIRQSDPVSASFSYGIAPLKHLILFIFPDFFGNATTGNWWGWATYGESAGYLGVMGIFFAIFYFFFGKNSKETSFFKILLLFCLLFAYQTPLALLPHKLNFPGLGTAASGRILFLVDFCLAVLAGFGIEVFLKSQKKKQILFTDLVFILIFAGTWLLVTGPARSLFKDASLIAKFQITKRNLILPTAIFLFLQVVIFSQYLKKINKTWVFTAIFLIGLFDVFRFGWKFNPFVDKDFLYPQTALTDFLKNNGGINRFQGMLPQSMWMPYKLVSLDGYEPMMIKRFSEFAQQIDNGKVKEVKSGSRWVGIGNYSSKILNFLGVKYIPYLKLETKTDWDPDYFKFPQSKFKLVFQYGKSQVYENKESLARAYLVHNYQVERNDIEILKAVKDELFNPEEKIILEEEPNFKIQPKKGKDEVEIDDRSYFLNDFVIKTKSESNSLLFLSDTYFPGWKAYLDGGKTSILRVNYTFRAVFVPQGTHTIRFVYDPDSFKIGLLISLVTLISTGVIYAAFLFDQRRYPFSYSVGILRKKH